MRFIAFFMLFFSAAAYAQQSTVHWGDNGKAKNYFIYKVAKGETLSAIARKYNVTVEAIKNMNPKLQTSSLAAGQTIRIPTKKGSTSETPETTPVVSDSLNHSTAIDTATKAVTKPAATVPVVYVVKKGDTYTAIIKKYKITDAAAFDTQNKLANHTLKIGQKLVVGQKTVTSNTPSTPTAKPTPTPPPNPRYSAKSLADCASDDMYVYTSQYPLGTALIIINPANKKAANVIVTADKPELPEYGHTQMLLSCALARHLEFDASQTQVEVILRK